MARTAGSTPTEARSTLATVAAAEECPATRALVKVAVRDGKQLDTIVHHGRTIPVELRTALAVGDPERLDGAVCVEDGCDRRHDLEMDHDDPIANGGASSYENIKLRCKPDHWAKTERDRKAGRLGGSRGRQGRSP